uniref:Uncharacterized protein n=1 Tax=Rhizophora mucronata TaxID=61149 RepID=A0A2P2IXH7_RHIMU
MLILLSSISSSNRINSLEIFGVSCRLTDC